MRRISDAEYGAIARGCEVREKNGVRWACSKRLNALGVTHGFTQRYGGVSTGAFESLNLGLNRPEPMENIMENYDRLCRAAGLKRENLALVNYQHGGNVERATAADCGKGFGHDEFLPCDGLVSNDSGVTLITLHADCMPVLLYDAKKNVCAAAHAGWKGARLCIGRTAAVKMQTEFGCAADDILAFIGPSISQKNFEVDEDVMLLFRKDFGDECVGEKGGGKYTVDLWRVMTCQLADFGLPLENIEISGVCTFDDTDYYSYRRDKRVSGAMAAFIRAKGGAYGA